MGFRGALVGPSRNGPGLGEGWARAGPSRQMQKKNRAAYYNFYQNFISVFEIAKLTNDCDQENQAQRPTTQSEEQMHV